MNIFETNIVLFEKAAKGWDLHVALFARFKTPFVTSFQTVSRRLQPSPVRAVKIHTLRTFEHCQCPPAGQLEGSVPPGQRPRTRAVTMIVTVNRPWNSGLNQSIVDDPPPPRGRGRGPLSLVISTVGRPGSHWYGCQCRRGCRRRAELLVQRGALSRNPCGFRRRVESRVLVSSGSYRRDRHVTLPET